MAKGYNSEAKGVFLSFLLRAATVWRGRKCGRYRLLHCSKRAGLRGGRCTPRAARGRASSGQAPPLALNSRLGPAHARRLPLSAAWLSLPPGGGRGVGHCGSWFLWPSVRGLHALRGGEG